MTNPLQRLPNSSVVQLEHFWIERFHIDLGDTPPAFDEKLWEPATRYSVNIFDNEQDPNLYRVQLRLRSERSSANPDGKHFDVLLSGVFSFPSNEVTIEDRQPFLQFNAPSILYGVARGLIASISGAGGVDALQLPSADFVRA